MSINLLTEEIINQIAAGEVIENPAAVIKELVENSIDANSTNIEVEIEDAGLKKILIKDNGMGISKEDLKKAPLRHATSKIKDFSDLYSIKTMGFRGEALASIFSISDAKITSKHEDSDDSYQISSQNINDLKLSASSKGTLILVENIFYNTPARKKYLRSSNLELKSIIDVMNRFIIYYHNIKFTLKHNNKILINKPQFKSREENLYYVLGKELRNNLIYFENSYNGIKISGFLGKPSVVNYGYKKNQYLYVNSRYVKSKLISDAIYEGFSTNLMEGRHPFFVISIDIDPEIIDVNVHPTKIELKFENELEIFELMKNTIKSVFERNEGIKSFEKENEKDISLDEMVDDISPKKEQKKNIVDKNSYYTKDVQRSFQVNEDILEYKKSIKPEMSSREEILEDKNSLEKNPSYGPLYELLKNYRIVGQIDKTFILIETEHEMIILDQHVVEEKFYYETFKEQLENREVEKQALLSPKIICFSQSEMLLYKENISLFSKLGFEIEEFGTNEVVVRKVPVGLNKSELNPDIVKDILGEITVDKKFKNLEEKNLEKIASLSCKKSLKAGDELTTPQIHEMIERLRRLKEPWSCPHGRPIMLRYTFKDLEKKFKRIV